jgi:H+-transporting ATPase
MPPLFFSLLSSSDTHPQISVSGQATIFVTRTRGFSFLDRPGGLLLGAFCIAQVIATAIGAFGLGGYPHNGAQDFEGCGWSYALLAWGWTFLCFVPLDAIKVLCYKYLFGKNLCISRIIFIIFLLLPFF